MSRNLYVVHLYCSHIIDVYKKLEAVRILIMLLMICGAIGWQVQPDNVEYEVVDDELVDQEVSALPAETSRESFLSKLKRKSASMIQNKKGLTIDSGAADHVMPLGWLAWILMVASAGSLRGLHYVAASGTRIPNMGQQTVRFLTQNGTWAQWVFQVAAVNKPLVSVSKLIDDGWRVVFDEEASYLKHKRTGNTINIRRERGVFVVDAFVDPAPADPKQQKSNIKNKGQVFTRPT